MSDIIIDNQNNKYKTDSDKKSEKTRIQMLSIDIPIVYINWNLFYF